MKKLRFFIFTLLVVKASLSGFGQITIYSENFDAINTSAYMGLVPESTPLGGWTVSTNQGQLTDGCFIDPYTCGCGFTYCIRNVWSIYNNGVSPNNAISGKSMGVSAWDGNTLVSGGQFDYWVEAATTRWVKHTLSFSGYRDLNIAFQWKCGGEYSGLAASDFGSVALSTNNGTTYSTLTSGGNGNTGKYFGKTSVQNADIDLSNSYNNVNNVILAFKWTCDDNGLGGGPTFIVDNVVVSGCPMAGSISPLSSTFSVSGSTTLSVTGVVAGASYQWQSASSSSGPWTDIAGANASSYTTPVLTETTYYRCAIGAGTCALIYQSSPAVVNITNSSCLPAEVISNPDNATVCHGSSTSFACNASGTAPISYLWQYSTDGGTIWNDFSDGNNVSGSFTTQLLLSSVSSTQSGMLLRCKVSNACGTDFSAQGLLLVNQSPMVFASNDTMIEPAGMANISCFAQGGTPPYTYTWQPQSSLNDPLVPATIAMPVQTTEYTVFVEDANGCIGSDVVTVKINSLAEVLIPNVITPNGDGKNDKFNILSEGVYSMDVSIFNRWGSKVISYNGLEQIWEGKSAKGDALDDGTYFYIVEVTDIEGKTFQYQGSVTLFNN